MHAILAAEFHGKVNPNPNTCIVNSEYLIEASLGWSY